MVGRKKGHWKGIRKNRNLLNKKKIFAKPQLIRHDQLHQVARFGVSGMAGLQSVGVAS